MRIPLIVSPPSPNISGINPPNKPQISTAIRILLISLEEIFEIFFCKSNKLFIKTTAIIAQTGPSKSDSVTDGIIEIFESVF